MDPIIPGKFTLVILTEKLWGHELTAGLEDTHTDECCALVEYINESKSTHDNGEGSIYTNLVPCDEI
eukprot:13912851-Ditylum_brightwellii.AAC.1